MKKCNVKWIIGIAAAVAAVGAAVAAVVVFWDQITAVINRTPLRRPKEYDDYADVED